MAASTPGPVILTEHPAAFPNQAQTLRGTFFRASCETFLIRALCLLFNVGRFLMAKRLTVLTPACTLRPRSEI